GGDPKPGAGPPLWGGEAAGPRARAPTRHPPAILKRWLDALDATGRWALLKLLTGALRVGVSARLAKQAAANIGEQPVGEVEEVWHGLTPPHRPLVELLLAGGAPTQTESRCAL